MIAASLLMSAPKTVLSGDSFVSRLPESLEVSTLQSQTKGSQSKRAQSAQTKGSQTKRFSANRAQAQGSQTKSQAKEAQTKRSPVKRPQTRGSSTRVLSREADLINKYVLILNLSDQQINRLRVNGSLSTRVPAKIVNRVGAVRIKRTESFRSDPFKVTNAKTQRSNSTASVEIDNSVLERLAYQPVDIQIFESGFNVLRLKFNALGFVAGKLPKEFEPSADQSAPFVFARINSKRGVYGSLLNFETLSIKTQFGEVDVPFADIDGIRFNDGNVNRAFVVLKKGDVFSGEIDLDTITLKSRWGEQELKVSELESITSNREIIFLRDAINPERWQLRSSMPVAAPAVGIPQNQNPLGSIPSSPNYANPIQLNQTPPIAYPQSQTQFGPFGFQ